MTTLVQPVSLTADGLRPDGLCAVRTGRGPAPAVVLSGPCTGTQDQPRPPLCICGL